MIEYMNLMGDVTVLEMCEALNIPSATLYRYLGYMKALLGEDCWRGVDGRYMISDDAPRLVRITGSERHALVVAGRILEEIGMPYREEFSRIIMHLCGHDADTAKSEHGRLRDEADCLLEFREPHLCRPVTDPSLVTRLYTLCAQRPRRPIRFGYDSRTSVHEKERLVWPVGLVFNNAWYLLGHDPAKVPHLRVYAVDHLRHAWRLVAGDGEPRPVLLRMPHRLAHEYKHASQQVVGEDEDKVRVRFLVSDPLEMSRFIMAHAHEIEVLEPETLRNEIKKRLKKALAAY